MSLVFLSNAVAESGERPGHDPQRVDHAPLVRKLLIAVAASSLFAVALVPLYNVLCEATGFNGKQFLIGLSTQTDSGFGKGGLGLANTVATNGVDRSRIITVDFTATVMPGLPWEVRPLVQAIDAHPGDMYLVRFLARNTSSRTIVAQAIPSFTPSQAGRSFQKIECFCFNQQSLAPGEAKEMPLSFVIKADMNQDIRNMTLAYSFFAIDKPQP